MYLREGNEHNAKKYLFKVIEYPNQTFKQGKHKLIAIAELGLYLKNSNNFNELKKLIEIYDNNFKYSQILKAAENSNLRDKLNSLKDYLDLSNSVTGYIKTVNIERGFVIIEEHNSNRTYFGHVKSFEPQISEITMWLKGKDVVFQPITETTKNIEKNEAIRIRITGVNNRLLIRPPKRRT